MDFAHPHFADSNWLWLAVVAPAVALMLLAWSARARRRQIRRLISVPPEGGQAITTPLDLFASHSPGRRRLKNGLIVIALAGMTLALARPQWGEQAEVAYAVGEDVLFLMDCSQSMLASDVRPNRLARAKLAVAEFIQDYPHGRLGLVAFAGQAFLQCPLTFDQTAIREALMALDVQTIPVPGTDLGQALEEGALALEKNDRRKIMVLITDGEDLEGNGTRVARDLAAKGVVIFTLGVGTPAGSPILLTDAQGRTSPLLDAKGNAVLSRLDEAALQTIAAATQGQYRPLGAAGEGLRRLQTSFDQLSPLPTQRARRTLGIDRFHFPVALATLLLVVESLLGTRRRSLTSRAGLVRAWLCLLIMEKSLTGMAWAQELDGLAERRSPEEMLVQGTQELLENKLREAEQNLTAAVGCQQEPVQEVALYNLGHVRFRQGQQALKEGPEPAPIRARQQEVSDHVPGVLREADAALISQRLEAILSAYRRSVAARKQIRSAADAVKSALEVYRTALLRWERSSGDFKSAFELDPKDDQARANAELVDRHIVRLIEQVQQLELALMQMEQKRKELQQRMRQMKPFLPDKEAEAGNEEDEDPEDQEPKPKPGDKEKLTREGKERSMNREEAARLLESLRIDAARKLPMNMDRTGQPTPRPGRTW
jgi:Ca-activated chloride channel homolog